MENQGWKGSSAHGSSPSQSPSHTNYQVQSTYFPSDQPESHYIQNQQPDDDPFNLRGSDNPFASSLSGQAEVVAVPDHSTVTINTGDRQANVVLQFQDSQLPTHGATGKMGDQVPRVGSYSEGRGLIPNQAAPDNDDDSEANKKYWFLNIRRYRRFFNVDTDDILIRIRDSVIGAYKADFFDKTSENADLYGPFWVATTLVFVIAATGNYANYVSYKKKHSGSSSTLTVWYSNVDKVGYSAILFYGYVGVLGLFLYACLRWWFKSKVTLPQVWCIYGYALSIYIPISFICILPYEVLRWVLVAVATATSGSFLLTNLKAPIFDVAGAKALPIYIAVGVAHVALGLVLKLYFFQYWS